MKRTTGSTVAVPEAVGDGSRVAEAVTVGAGWVGSTTLASVAKGTGEAGSGDAEAVG